MGMCRTAWGTQSIILWQQSIVSGSYGTYGDDFLRYINVELWCIPEIDIIL